MELLLAIEEAVGSKMETLEPVESEVLELLSEVMPSIHLFSFSFIKSDLLTDLGLISGLISG